MTTSGATQLDPFELATGFALGCEPGLGPLRPEGSRGESARAAFEAVLLEALLRPPCVLSFSGGRDSSAVLAVAIAVADREGLPRPHAVTLRFNEVPSSAESRWQEQVIEAAGVTDWTVLDITDELDLLGPWSREQIAAHGVLWPPNTHFHAPVVARAAGGTLVTGFGGDEIMSPGWAWDRWNFVRTRQVRPRPADLREALGAHGPRRLRGWVLDHRPEPRMDSLWLTSAGQEAIDKSWRDLRISEPVRHDRAVTDQWWRMRYRSVTVDSFDRIARAVGAQAVHPFAHPRFLSAVAAERGRNGPRSRTRAMAQLFADVLPMDSIRRQSKATFNGAFFGPASRAFVAGWSGAEVADNPWIDVEKLRRAWQGEEPDARTYPLLQVAWARSVASASGQPG